MIAKSLDIVVLLKLLSKPEKVPYAELSKELFISASEIHAAFRRSIAAGLIAEGTREPRRRALQDYLIHGVAYAFPAAPGRVARGVPTAYAAPPLSRQISADDLPPVWADPDGTVKGYSIEPLYISVTSAIKKDQALYELLALVDTLRIGRARERRLAEEEIKHRLSHAHAA
jgi:DNA-binding Lrp family transcriptional regulator